MPGRQTIRKTNPLSANAAQPGIDDVEGRAEMIPKSDCNQVHWSAHLALLLCLGFLLTGQPAKAFVTKWHILITATALQNSSFPGYEWSMIIAANIEQDFDLTGLRHCI